MLTSELPVPPKQGLVPQELVINGGDESGDVSLAPVTELARHGGGRAAGLCRAPASPRQGQASLHPPQAQVHRGQQPPNKRGRQGRASSLGSHAGLAQPLPGRVSCRTVTLERRHQVVGPCLASRGSRGAWGGVGHPPEDAGGRTLGEGCSQEPGCSDTHADETVCVCVCVVG